MYPNPGDDSVQTRFDRKEWLLSSQIAQNKCYQKGECIQGIQGEVAEADSKKYARRTVPRTEFVTVWRFQGRPAVIGPRIASQSRASLSAAMLCQILMCPELYGYLMARFASISA